jgi:hypothetical protein
MYQMRWGCCKDLDVWYNMAVLDDVVLLVLLLFVGIDSIREQMDIR